MFPLRLPLPGVLSAENEHIFRVLWDNLFVLKLRITISFEMRWVDEFVCAVNHYLRLCDVLRHWLNHIGVPQHGF
jgi:hypothetical protein